MDAGFTDKNTVRRALNRMAPAAKHAELGTTITDIINAANVVRSTRQLTKAGLVIKAGSSAIVKAGAAFAAVVGGVPVRKAANTDMAALVGTLATAKSAAWAFYIDGSGTLSASAKTADAASHDAALALLPAPPAGVAMIGFIVVDNATGSNFVGGTTALDTGSLTVTYYDHIGPSDFSATSVGALGTR